MKNAEAFKMSMKLSNNQRIKNDGRKISNPSLDLLIESIERVNLEQSGVTFPFKNSNLGEGEFS